MPEYVINADLFFEVEDDDSPEARDAVAAKIKKAIEATEGVTEVHFDLPELI